MTGTSRSAIAVSDAPPPLLDAVVRLLRLLLRQRQRRRQRQRLLDEPRDRAALAPLVTREIL
ncbi:hypothetical protein ACIQ6K_35840 [Streptomyces sp. NPDC096354]|uniref:hypothetical protein n=1 Tax=Streptomyces sp. NPDC096354 TaxID=3366088 RepID=UPI0038275833